MVKLDKIYTKGGDKGKTSLVGGERVSKNHERIIAIGSVDELNALLGLTTCYLKSPHNKLIRLIQNDLFDVGADLATPLNRKKNVLRINNSYTSNLEKEIDKINSSLSPLTSFILPGGNKVSSLFHLARTVCRRCETSIVKLKKENNINIEVVKYINRLSDLFFVLARSLNNKETLWQPQKRYKNKKE